MQRLLDLSVKQLAEALAVAGHPSFRARQIRRWLYSGRAGDFADMTDLPKKLRDELSNQFEIFSASISKHSRSEDGTEKLLLRLADGGQIECVLLRDGIRRSICVSTQVGCAMGCVFCASGLDGVDRNLTRGEILEQMLLLQRLLPPDERLSHIVVMGMGEPLANISELLVALDEATHTEGLAISARRITISTVGIPKAMKKLADNDTRYQLAVSLHAPNDRLRNELVPVNEKTGLHDILAAADHYFEISGRRLTYEYVLLAGINDQPGHADELVTLLHGRTALLNVIPYNPVAGLPYETPSTATQHQFRQILENGGLNVMFRQRKGSKIDAACGQLRRMQTVDIQLENES